MRRNRLGKLRPGERASPQRAPAHCGPAERASRRHPHAADGGRERLGKEGGPARPGGLRAAAASASGRGPPGGPGGRGPEEGGDRALRARAPHLARGRSGGGAGGRGAGGCGARSTKHRPSPAAEAGEPRPSPRPRVRGARDAAQGAGALCLGSSGAPLASASRPGPRRALPAFQAPASFASRSRGSQRPVGAGEGRGPRAAPLHRRCAWGRGSGFPGLRLSPRLSGCPRL